MISGVIEFNSRGESGNIFFILGRVRRLMQEQRRISEYNDMWEAVHNSESYEDALKIIGQHVSLYDSATGKVW